MNPGDLVFSDAVNGVVVIPQDKVDNVISMLPALIEADDRVKDDVKKGLTVQEAFKKHRGWLIRKFMGGVFMAVRAWSIWKYTNNGDKVVHNL